MKETKPAICVVKALCANKVGTLSPSGNARCELQVPASGSPHGFLNYLVPTIAADEFLGFLANSKMALFEKLCLTVGISCIYIFTKSVDCAKILRLDAKLTSFFDAWPLRRGILKFDAWVIVNHAFI